MIDPNILTPLSADSLRSIYRAEANTGSADLAGIEPEDWPEVRRCALVQYWRPQLSLRLPLTQAQFNELVWAVRDPSLRHTCSSVVGDAAKVNILEPGQLAAALEENVTPYARRALKARRAMLVHPSVDETMIRALLEQRAAWAIAELIGAADWQTLAIMEGAIDGEGVSKAERHDLRMALKKRRRAVAPAAMSRVLNDRPVRWAPHRRERTLEVFDTDVEDRKRVVASVEPILAVLKSAVGGAVELLFYTLDQTKTFPELHPKLRLKIISRVDSSPAVDELLDRFARPGDEAVHRERRPAA